MKVIRAGTLGFCMGVRRAVEMAWRESSPGDGSEPAEGKGSLPGKQVYTLGPLIHNPGVLKSLEARGVKVLEEGSDFSLLASDSASQNTTVIIRAHGVPPSVEKDLANAGLRVLDATCPHVKVSQLRARTFAEKGYVVFLAGEEHHAEIAGIRGFVSAASAAGVISPCHVVGSGQEAEKAAAELYSREPDARTVLIGQTTISPGEYRAIGEKIQRFFPDIEILNTICACTAERQEALRELCAKVDAVIIAGGRESANTRRLFSLAQELGKPAWLVENAAHIPPEIGSYKTVGLSAGASTPDTLVDEIEAIVSSKQ
ncbi:MAG: 4-hydroxy-3-methylbut-2-enyl diphosphate reductase [Treponema sp.]|nr:4-hydroxy-3-methylbut-2-enyl diphosphate reductase [Treponema sp.]